MLTIIRNLTDNANKYTGKGTIALSASREGNGLILLVADTGRGMTPRQLDAFMGRGNLDEVRSGSQLGHVFISDLTQRLGGTLSVESSEGLGTRVGIRIPMEPAPPESQPGV